MLFFLNIEESTKNIENGACVTACFVQNLYRILKID